MSKRSRKPGDIEVQLARYERIIKAAVVMTDREKAELAEWEKTHLTGDAPAATSDWPGWVAIINRISH